MVSGKIKCNAHVSISINHLSLLIDFNATVCYTEFIPLAWKFNYMLTTTTCTQ